MNKKAFITLLVCIAFPFGHLRAIPAYPKKVPIVIDGDTIYVQMRGDENCKFAVNEEGYTLLPSDGKWYYAMKNEDGNVVASSYKAASSKRMNDEVKRFLQHLPKGITPQRLDSPIAPSANHVSTNRSPIIGTRKILVILMQFRDRRFVKESTDFQRLFNEPNYTDDGAIGSVNDYYRWASYGQLDVQSDIVGPYTAQHEMAYYGGNTSVGGYDKNPYALFEEAINEAVKEIDLADYDVNNDGYVDNVHIIYAGYGEEAGASSNAIWAHEMTFNAITIQGMKIDKYSCAPELRGNNGNGISRIGPHCHEIGHALGAMDYYDTDYEVGGNYLGTGDWDIMASGSWNNDGISPADFNPYVKVYNYGWADVQTLQSDTINIIDSNNIFRIDTGTKGDFFLLENRDGTGFHAAEPGKGLLIFHIGPQLEAKAASNKINASYPQQCYVVCASSTYKYPSSSASSYGKINSDGCPFPGSSNAHDFTDDTTPAAYTVRGVATGIRLEDINVDGNSIRLFAGNCGYSDEITDEKVSFWSEDFEQMRIPSSWDYFDLIGIGEFSVVTTLSNHGTTQSPLAANGKGYAKFSAVSQNGINRHRTRGLLTTSKIELSEKGKYSLSLQARKFAKLQDANDTLTIRLFDAEGNCIATPIQQSLANQDEWIILSTTLTDSLTEFYLGIDCNTDYGTTMFLDDIKIVEASIESNINKKTKEDFIITPTPNGICIVSNIRTDFAIYSIDGRCYIKDRIVDNCPMQKSLPKGMYIVQVGAINKKVMVK